MTPEYPARQWIPVVFGDSVFHNTVTQVLSHPAEAATRTELHYFAPSTENDLIDTTVDRLIEVGILQEIGDEPFIGFTEDGKQFVVDSRLYRGSDVMKSVYMKTELTDEVREVADIARPDWYLEEIAGREFEERDEVHQGEAFQDGWDRVMYNTRLTVESSTGLTALQATFERATGVRGDAENAENFEVVTERTYELSADEQEAIEDLESVFEVREGSEGVMNRSDDESAYTIEFDAFIGESAMFSPSYSIDVKRESGGTVLSTYIEPNRDSS